MAVFAYNFNEMENVINQLGEISAALADSVQKVQAEISRLQEERAAAEAAYNSAMESYRSAMANWDGKGTAPTPPSRDALNSIEQAILQAQEQLQTLQNDAKALEEVKGLMEHTKSLVETAEGEVLGYINTKLLDLRDFSIETGVAVANALGSNTTNSLYVQSKSGTKYYAAMYEDFEYEDYQKLADKIGVPMTLAIMGANGISEAQGRQLVRDSCKDYSGDKIQKYMHAYREDKKESVTEKDLKSSGVFEVHQLSGGSGFDTMLITAGMINIGDSRVSAGVFDGRAYTIVDGNAMSCSTTQTLTEQDKQMLMYIALHEAGGEGGFPSDLSNPEAQLTAIASTFMNAYEVSYKDNGELRTFAEAMETHCTQYAADSYTKNTITNMLRSGSYENLDFSAYTPEQIAVAEQAVNTVLGGTRNTNATGWQASGDGITNKFTRQTWFPADVTLRK